MAGIPYRRLRLLVVWSVVVVAGYLRFERGYATAARLIVLALTVVLVAIAWRFARATSRVIMDLPEEQRRATMRLVGESKKAKLASLRARGARGMLVSMFEPFLNFLIIAYAFMVGVMPKISYGTYSPMVSALATAVISALASTLYSTIVKWRTVKAT